MYVDLQYCSSYLMHTMLTTLVGGVHYDGIAIAFVLYNQDEKVTTAVK